jgi:hypothetical protein
LAKGIAILYGVYDLTRNAGYVFVGTTTDTSDFGGCLCNGQANMRSFLEMVKTRFSAMQRLETCGNV